MLSKRNVLILLFSGIFVLGFTFGAWANQVINIVVNGQVIQSDVPAQIINGRTMLPISVVARALGADVKWDNSTHTVIISTIQISAQPNMPNSAVTPSTVTSEQSQPGNSSSNQKVTKGNNVELTLVDSKGKFLGDLTTNEFDPDSIFNKFGTYGNKFSSDSIWNEFGDYGSKFSSKSAFNDFASDPPIIVAKTGNKVEVIGYLTTNKFLPGAISPYDLKTELKELGF